MRRASAIVALAGIWIAGCGGTTLSTRELRSRSTRLCRIAAGQTARVATPTMPAGGARFLKQGIAALEPELRGLRSLHPSRELAHVYSTAVGGFAQKLDALRATDRTLNAGDDPVIAIKSLQRRLTPLETQENSAWLALGIPACVDS